MSKLSKIYFFLEADFMSADEFHQRIQKRKKQFRDQVQERSFFYRGIMLITGLQKKLAFTAETDNPMD